MCYTSRRVKLLYIHLPDRGLCSYLFSEKPLPATDTLDSVISNLTRPALRLTLRVSREENPNETSRARVIASIVVYERIRSIYKAGAAITILLQRSGSRFPDDDVALRSRAVRVHSYTREGPGVVRRKPVKRTVSSKKKKSLSSANRNATRRGRPAAAARI